MAHDLLRSIASPVDVRSLSPAQLPELADQIRQHLVSSVARTGGHLGPNLGVVELTIAIHRVFSSPRDTVIFDTGHQCYVHKLVTGRQDFSTLRSREGLAGYPSRAESPHDVVEDSHASTSLSWAHGISRGRRLTGEDDRATVVVIGDGALTGGMAWEALNNIAGDPDANIVIVVNDNARSYAPTIGGLARHLTSLRTAERYENTLDLGKRVLRKGGAPGRMAYETLHGLKKGIKDIVAPQVLFEDLGLKYIGPVDGHDLASVEDALRAARAFGGPVIVHAITRKGNGYAPAMADDADQFHAIGIINPETGLPLQDNAASWTGHFASEMVALGSERPDVVALTGAMLIPVGLHKFAEVFPDRVFDVGIAEQHAVTSAAGMAFAGLHPVVALYATFLNRAFDQVLMDVALHRAGVTFVLDRAGVTGPDGASHHGMWDLALLPLVPGIRIAAPRDTRQLGLQLREAVEVDDGPTVIRFPKATVGDDIPAVRSVDGIDVLVEPGADASVLVVGVGAMVPMALSVAAELVARGIPTRVVDPRWVVPITDALVDLASGHDLVVSIEDGLREGGVGTHLAQRLGDAGSSVRVLPFGLPTQFLPHGTRDEVLAAAGLSVDDVVASVVEALGRQ